MKMMFSAPAHISGISPPETDCMADGDLVINESTNLRSLQRVVAVERFQRSSYDCSVTVLLVKVAAKNSHVNGRTRYSYWLAKVLRLMNVLDSITELSYCTIHG